MVADFLIIAGIAIGLALLTQLINKLMINEKYVDESKEKVKKMQKDLKDLDPKSKKFKEKQDKIIDINFKMMKQQFKPMLFTFLPYIIVFYLMGNAFAFAPIEVGSQVQFDVDGTAAIESECLKLNKTIEESASFDATVNSNNCDILINGKETNIDLIGKKEEINTNVEDASITITPPKQVFINLPFKLPFIGDKIGWLGTFIIFSFASSMILNKALKGVYLRDWD